MGLLLETAKTSRFRVSSSWPKCRQNGTSKLTTRASVQQETGVDDVMSAFMVIGNSYPFPAAIYQASTAMINVGRDGYKRNLKRYKECLDKNEWPQLNDGNIAVVELPKYMIGV